MAKNDLQGALDLLVLKTLAYAGKMHGYGIVLHIQRASDDLLRVEEGSLSLGAGYLARKLLYGAGTMDLGALGFAAFVLAAVGVMATIAQPIVPRQLIPCTLCAMNSLSKTFPRRICTLCETQRK